MRSIALVFVSIALFAGDAFAGKIFGDISYGGKPVAAGVKVKATLPDVTTAVDTTATDKFGSYKLFVKVEGKVKLIVWFEGKALELPIFSNKEATRYDLVIEKKEDKLSLRRK